MLNHFLNALKTLKVLQRLSLNFATRFNSVFFSTFSNQNVPQRIVASATPIANKYDMNTKNARLIQNVMSQNHC